MTPALLGLLRCPFCGGSLHVHDRARRDHGTGAIVSGVIWCECCAFPVVAGIPVLKADDTARQAMAALEAGRDEEALLDLLGLEGPAAEAFRRLAAGGEGLTYRDAIGVLSPDPEGTYFLYRFSDPTFVMAEAVVRALSQEPLAFPGRVLDLCGGSGHLTRVLGSVRPPADVVVADMFFWKLWLARAFTAPSSAAVCCDANQPLPFAAGAFPTIVLSDAFPYIWHKRLLAGEMIRCTGRDGLIVMPHLHSSLGWNHSAGMTLTPRSYRNLFADLGPRLFADEDLLAQALDEDGLDLSRDVAPDALGAANAFTLVASHDARLFRHFAPVPLPSVSGMLTLNPLYRVTRRGRAVDLELTFPSQAYADEFGACRRYLPDHVTLDLEPAGLSALAPETLDRLRRQRVILDVPARYC